MAAEVSSTVRPGNTRNDARVGDSGRTRRSAGKWPSAKTALGAVGLLEETRLWGRHVFRTILFFLRTTLLFVLSLGCIYLLRMLVVMLFSPGEYLRELLEVVDTYAVLLGTIGYVAWIGIDILFLAKERAGKNTPV